MSYLKSFLIVCNCMFLISIHSFAGDKTIVKKHKPAEPVITLPTGFAAVKVASGLGRPRHLAVAANGDVFVKLDKLKNGKGIIRLHSNGNGQPNTQTGYGNFPGTGIAIKNGYLYASTNTEVFRYKLNEKTGVVDELSKQKIVTGLWDHHEHEAKAVALDNAGNLYVNIGAPSNCCQVEDRVKGSPSQDPCPILDSAGGIWQFKADKLNQSYAQGERYATGLRNVVGLFWNTEVNDLYVMQHGRDQLFQFFPDLFDQKAGAENPAEEMFRVKKGSDCGWPYCYFDNDKKAKLLNPEYGGDRTKAGRCEMKTQSVVQFPGHLAPDGLLFYTGTKFPAKYKNGAFVAFHGSWNRAPEPQAGYFVVFVPFKDGMPTGKWEVFADGFAGSDINDAYERPCGLAQGTDGSLYVSDDKKGNVWKISYKGN
jgi:glucose/arabinose dehydrogenase